jgi:H+/Cl- antiporter ClcA
VLAHTAAASGPASSARAEMPPPDGLRASLQSSSLADPVLADCACPLSAEAGTRDAAGPKPDAPAITVSAAEDRQLSSTVKPSRVELTLCLLLVLLGCSTCAVAWAMQRVIEAMQFLHRQIEFMDSGSFLVDVATWAGFRVVLVLGAVFCTTSISPRAAGSGIPEMKCILAGLKLDEHMSNATVLAKVIGVVLMCGAGMPVGREGPLVHIAGSIALGLLRLRAFKSIAVSEVRRHEVLAAACAVGVTATFGAPLGGVLFSIEVTTTYFLTSSYWHSFVCAVTGCVFFRYADAHGGMGTESSELGSRSQLIGSSQLFDIDYVVLPVHVLLGVVCGLLASAFITIAAFLFRFTRPWSKRYTELDEYTLTPRTRHNHRMLTMRYRKYWYAGVVALLGGLAEYSIASRGDVHSDESSGGFMTSGLFKCTYDFMYFEDLSNATGTIPSLDIEWMAPTNLPGIDETDEKMSDEEALLTGDENAQPADSLLGLCSQQTSQSSQSARDIQTTVYNEDWGEYGGVIGSLCIWCVHKLVFASLSLTIFAPAGCLGPCIAIGETKPSISHV